MAMTRAPELEGDDSPSSLVQPTPVTSANARPGGPVEPPPRRARVFLAIASTIVIAVAAFTYLVRLGSETTDRALVAARVVTVAAEGAGTVTEVLVDDHATVEKGAPLVRFDPAPLEARLAHARAELASAEAALVHANKRASLVESQVDTTAVVARGDEAAAFARQRSLEEEAASAQAALEAAQVASEVARKELERVRSLHAQRAISDAQLEEARARQTQAEAALRRARAMVAATSADRTAASGARQAATGRVKLSTSGAEKSIARADVELAEARVAEAKATLELAQIDLRHATIVSPVRGVVEKRRVEPGSFVAPGTELLVVVSQDEVWIDAEFKESQIAKLAKGQHAAIELDAFSGVRLAGHVDSIGGATVARTSLLQASGNGFARATQRVPVRIALDEKPKVPLAAGLNATVTVEVGKR